MSRKIPLTGTEILELLKLEEKRVKSEVIRGPRKYDGYTIEDRTRHCDLVQRAEEMGNILPENFEVPYKEKCEEYEWACDRIRQIKDTLGCLDMDIEKFIQWLDNYKNQYICLSKKIEDIDRTCDEAKIIGCATQERVGILLNQLEREKKECKFRQKAMEEVADCFGVDYDAIQEFIDSMVEQGIRLKTLETLPAPVLDEKDRLIRQLTELNTRQSTDLTNLRQSKEHAEACLQEAAQMMAEALARNNKERAASRGE
jgi:hypothetical protein